MSSPSRSTSDALTSAVAEYLAAQRKTPDDRPPGTSPPTAPATAAREASGGSMRSAYEEVLRHEAQKLEATRVARPSLWRRLRGPLVLMLVLGASSYVWFGHPEFLREPPHTALQRPHSTLTGSRQLVAVALELEDYRRSTGRLPENLQALGLAVTHISYTVLPDGKYELRTGTGPHVLVYHGAVGAEAEVREESTP